ncbi:MAG: hypothetical protein A2W19_09570 [Spirochaetes bacterium RBG_16_49_21]|nr:MAG: hypothetical protein A2W19_09570 [Spirochaetes bacterium RBG_16_49_21]
MKCVLVFSLIFTTALALDNDSRSQEDRKIELSAQGILARVDRILKYPRGLARGALKHIRPDGSSAFTSFKGFIAGDDCLFTFTSSERGDQLKVLYSLGGEDIWVYDILALKLFHKLGIDKYDEILSTNFSYIDLAHADFQSNYTAAIQGPAFVKGTDAYKLVLNPIAKGGEYGGLTMYVSRDRYIPLRIDFLDRDKAIFKFMTVVKVMENDRRIIPVRYDMMNIRQGTLTIMSFTEFDETASFDKEIFRSEKLGE